MQLVINLKTANALGITIPPLLLNQADKVADNGVISILQRLDRPS